MRHDLMAEQIEIDPGIGTAPLWTAKHGTIKLPCRLDIIHWKGNMERR
jgi:hypothetical protein